MVIAGLPDAGTDPAGFLLAMADRVEADSAEIVVESPRLATFIQAQVALWRAIVAAEPCFGKEFRPVAAAAVGAARAYLTGAQ